MTYAQIGLDLDQGVGEGVIGLLIQKLHNLDCINDLLVILNFTHIGEHKNIMEHFECPSKSGYQRYRAKAQNSEFYLSHLLNFLIDSKYFLTQTGQDRRYIKSKKLQMCD